MAAVAAAERAAAEEVWELAEDAVVVEAATEPASVQEVVEELAASDVPFVPREGFAQHAAPGAEEGEAVVFARLQELLVAKLGERHFA